MYIGKQLIRGQNNIIDDISSGFNGSTTAFSLTASGDAVSPATVNQMFVSLGGVLQKPGTDFTLSSSTITFTTAPTSGLSFWCLVQGDSVDLNAPSDASVTPSKISANGDFAFPADIRLKDADGSHYVGLQAPATVGSNVVWTLPAADGTANYVLKTDGSGNLGWAADSSTDSTKMPLAGGTFTGDVTFTGDASNGLWDKSASAFVADLTGTASIATTITVADESSDTTCNVLFTTDATGNLAPKSGTNLTFNSSSGALTATSFVGALTGNASTATNASGLTGSPNITVGTIGCGAITGTSTVSDSKGNLRTIVQNTQGSTYTLVAADAGKHILASGTVTVPNSVFSAGDAVTIVNNTASNLTITKSITTMYNSADGTSANRTLATRGMATILFASGTVAYISGAGLS